jgi:hypothetical protein
MSLATVLEASTSEFHRTITELQKAFQAERECITNDGLVAAEAFLEDHPEYNPADVYRLVQEKVQEEIGKLLGRLRSRITEEQQKWQERNRRLGLS